MEGVELEPEGGWAVGILKMLYGGRISTCRSVLILVRNKICNSVICNVAFENFGSPLPYVRFYEK